MLILFHFQNTYYVTPEVGMPADALVPAAQYLRMSTERQEYSLDNQSAAIRHYAENLGFTVVRTYEDAGKSGLTIGQRSGLKALLTDVLGGKASYRAVLVYDVSRWGRFQDADEAAHYEYLVKSAGIRVHYCAEQFGNDDTLPSHILKALKRTMAAEFSRELGERVFAGKKRLVALGFHPGAQPGYGLRRVMVSAEGRVRQELRSGETKCLTTDRVVLVPGTRSEVRIIKWIYNQFIHRWEMTDIFKDLNLRKVPWQDGKPWNLYAVRQILTNPKYTGCNLWARTSQKLRSKVRPNPPDQWVIKQGAFAAIVDQSTFDRAQRIIANKTYRKSNDVLLQELKRFWKRRGRLSEAMIDRTRCVPSCSTLRHRFGSMARVYELIGFRPARVHAVRTAMRGTTERLRREVLEIIFQLYGNDVTLVRKNKRSRERVQFAGSGQMNVVICRSGRERVGLRYWNLYAGSAARSLPTLACLLSPHNDTVETFYLVPNIDAQAKLKLTPNDPWFKRGLRLRTLVDLLPALKEVVTWVPLGSIYRGVSNAMAQLMGPSARTRTHDSERKSVSG